MLRGIDSHNMSSSSETKSIEVPSVSVQNIPAGTYIHIEPTGIEIVSLDVCRDCTHR